MRREAPRVKHDRWADRIIDRRNDGFAVDDIQSECERLRTLGVAFRSEPQRMGPTTIAVFDDTCGNLIQIYQA